MKDVPPLEAGSWSGFFRRNRNELGLALATIAVVAATALWSRTYLDHPVPHLQNVLRETALLGIFAFGAAIVIIAGGIDLSSGSMIAFSGTIFTGIIVLLAPKSERGLPTTADLELTIILVAVLGSLVAGLVVGTFHAWLVTVIELPPFVATLASLVGLRSLAKLLIGRITEISHGQSKSTITIDNELLLSVSQQTGWWVPVVIWLVIAAAFWLLLSRTVVGRHLYAMGGNEEAARLSGIRTERLKWLAYCIGTVTASISGILYTCYVGTADPSRDGLGYELNAIASAVVGGCSLTGGVGTITGVMLGALFLRVVVDAAAWTFKTRPDLFEGLVVGILVVLAVAFNELRGAAGLKKRFFPGAFGWINVFILAVLIATVAYVTAPVAIAVGEKLRRAGIVGGITLLVLAIRAVMERVHSER